MINDVEIVHNKKQESEPRIVLVGTYKGEQLIKWRGWYCYPISENDTVSDSDAKRINELWLFKGLVEQKAYKAIFVGIKTREELIKEYEYPAEGKAHGDKYLLFKTTFKYLYKSTIMASVEKIIVRTSDFATSPQVRKQLKAFLESDEREDPSLSKLLPSPLLKIPHQILHVCEAWRQLTFFDICDLRHEDFNIPFPSPTHPKFTFIDLFAGIGGIRLGFQETGGQCVFSSEWDAAAAKTYFTNFGEMPRGDITKISTDEIPDFDVLLAGFPCQPFSISGKMKGFSDTRGTLFFDVCRIIEAKRPKVVFLENVKHLVHHDNGNTLKVILQKLRDFGYTVSWKVLNGSDFGVPQNRERIIIIGAFGKTFDFERIKTTEKQVLVNFLDKSGPFEFLKPDEYTLLDNTKKQEESGLIFAGYRNKSIRKVGVRPNTLHLSRVHKQPNRIYSVMGIHPTLPSQESSGRYFVLLQDNTVRKLTLSECWRIMGFPEKYIKVSSTGEQYRQLGNSVCVPMIKAVASEVIKQLLNGGNK